MGVEIERKFLVADESWRRDVVEEQDLRQGYLSEVKERVVRVRLVDDRHAVLTIKGVRVGDRRPEFEYPIPADDARYLLDELCRRPLIEKRRYRLGNSPGEWTVDVFRGANAGLTLAEIEFDGDITEGEAVDVDLPGWIGREVTTDDRFANSYLSEHPFTGWSDRV